VCGCLAIEGAHRDVLRGLDRTFSEYLAGPDVWITTGRAENSLTTEGFPAARAARRIRKLEGVRRVDAYYGGLLDLGKRRVWIIAPGAHDASPIPPSQLLHGDLATAERRIRTGGWIAVSNVLAAARRADVGDRFRLPTPSGVASYRVAAITTNLGWGPGAVIMSDARFRRDWLAPDPTALAVLLRPGVSATTARHAIQVSLGTGTALHVQTTSERDAQFRALARGGLHTLSEISTLLAIAAALALAAGTIAAIWQRRVSLTVLRLSGHLPRELWLLLLLEAGIALATGCLAGIVAGIAGHGLLARWLAVTTGYPAPFSIGGSQVLRLTGTILAAALALIGVASARLAKAEPRSAARW
jgi:putative ABC transport system permease protein